MEDNNSQEATRKDGGEEPFTKRANGVMVPDLTAPPSAASATAPLPVHAGVKRPRHDASVAHTTAAPVTPMAPPVPPLLWVKRMDVAGAHYDKVRSQFADVADVIHAVVSEQRMDVAPSLVTLKLVCASGEEPTPEEEAAAVPLKPTLPMHTAISRASPGGSVATGCIWLLAFAPPPAVTRVAPRMITLDTDPATTACEGVTQDVALTRFYAAAVAAKPVTDSIGARLWRLHDPNDASKLLLWPMLEQRVLLERDFYDRFYSDPTWLGSLPLQGPQRKYAVLGQPGIGKSAFGWWLITMLLRRGRTVVYSRNSAKRGTPPEMVHYVFHRDVALKAHDLWYVDALLAAASTTHICDSCKPRLGDPCHKIMITSPDPDIYRWFAEKEGADLKYFPLYGDLELEALRAAEFGDALPAAVLAQRVRAWGPVPRQVFSLKQADVKVSVERALANADFDELQRAMDDVESSRSRPTDESPHSLFLLHADRNTLASGTVSFRSHAVATRMLQRLAARQYDSMLHAMQQLLQSGSTRTLAGKLFEVAALERFRRGCTLPVRPLLFRESSGALSPPITAAPAESFTFPKAVLSVPFNSLTDITTACRKGVWSLTTHRFTPVSRNWAAVDSIEVGLRLMQITTTRARHALKVTSGRSEGEGLAAIARTLLPLLPPLDGDATPYLEVYFVVPEGRGTMFKPQMLQFHDGASCPEHVPVGDHAASQYNLGFRVDGKLVEVRQFVLEVPLAEFRTADAALPRDDIDAAGET